MCSMECMLSFCSNFAHLMIWSNFMIEYVISFQSSMNLQLALYMYPCYFAFCIVVALSFHLFSATTTPTMTLMATFTPESDNLGLIIGVVIAAVVVGGGAIGFSVYWFGIRTSDQESVKRSNNEVGISTANKEKSDKLLYESTGNNFDPPGGADNNTVTASTNETTNSAAPVYGVVNKSTKKKSDNTDGNGVNSKLQSEPDQVEYAAVNKPKSDPQPAPRSSKPPGNNTEPEKMELQYADIDHSNRGRSNEIRQPADEPTEYATVQSVIV
ncbi:hypothetical protein HOLleu_21669 [Holothuria leucospilota]|uniref:Uncharacterized protein n=1 Tax=Holothuria leucospilota TaxID=206669 RepID=A0A9Q1BXL2_HOLLE|nr:hypothetical protein HOLleu_21669 [Holothuria leucospilota]